MSTRSVADPVAAEAGWADPHAVRDLARRCEERLDALIERIAAQWRVQLPGYQVLRDAEHEAVLRQAVSGFLRTLRGVPVDLDLRALFRTRALRRVEQGVPLPTLLRAYTIATYALFDGLRQEARADEATALADVARLLFLAQDEAITEVAGAYQEELAALSAARRDRRRELARDLVTGSQLPNAAVLDEFGLGTGAMVLALRLGTLSVAGPIPQQRPDAEVPVTVAAIDVPEPVRSASEAAIRHKLLRLQQAIDAYFGRPVPALLEQPGGYVLVPRTAIDSDSTASDTSTTVTAATTTIAETTPGSTLLEELSRRLSEVWGDEIRIAVAVADRPDQVGAVAATAAEVLRLVCALGKPPGVYTLDDVLLEYHLTRQDESAQLLGALLDPLADRPDLLRTVRVFLEEQYDRRRTARRLSLHPNTVDNRLDRVTELTGLNPATPRGVALLMTALALHDLR